MTGHAGFMTSALLSPSACTSFSPRWFLTVIFAPGVDGVTLRTVSQAEHAGPFRRPVRENFDNNQARADIERFLPQIKLAAEQQQAIATSVDSPAQKSQEQAQNMNLFALNADLQKDAVGFANLDGLKGIHLIVHSLRADQIHYSVLISDEKFMGACVYTICSVHITQMTKARRSRGMQSSNRWLQARTIRYTRLSSGYRYCLVHSPCHQHSQNTIAPDTA